MTRCWAPYFIFSLFFFFFWTLYGTGPRVHKDSVACDATAGSVRERLNIR